MDFEYLDGVRIRALTSIMDPDEQAWLQGVFEWYSKEYHTPLHTIQDLPLDTVIYVYYRAYYKGLEPEDRHNEAIWLLETPAERAARVNNDKNREDELMQKSRAHNAGKATKGSKDATKKIEALLKKMRKQQDEPAGDGIGQKTKMAGERPMINRPIAEETEVGLGPAPSYPIDHEPEVVVKYLPAGDLEAELDRSPGPAPRPRGVPRKPKK